MTLSEPLYGMLSAFCASRTPERWTTEPRPR